MNRAALVAEDAELSVEREKLSRRLDEIRVRRVQIECALDIRTDILDRDQLGVAASLLDCHGRVNGARRPIIADARREIVQGGGKLRHEYFGSKNYAGWSDQRSDHPYCYSPSHGTIVFSVGLRANARKEPLTPAEREACLYALDCIDQGLLDGEQLAVIARESRRATS